MTTNNSIRSCLASFMLHFSCFIFVSFPLYGQGSGLPLDNPAYHMLNRMEIQSGIRPPFHAALKFYTRKQATAYALQMDTSTMSQKDRFNWWYIMNDNNEWLATADFPTTLGGPDQRIIWDKDSLPQTQVEASLKSPYYKKRKKPIFKIFYPTPANFVEVNDKFFHLRVNPLLNLRFANANDEQEPVFLNQRGVELRGGIDDRVYFYTNIIETQQRFPDYVNDRITRDLAVPGAGFYKTYQSTLFDITNGYDYLNGQGYIGFNISNHIGLQFGHGRHFIGNGYRSLFLSDFSNNYFYLKLNTQVGRIHYQNLFAELNATSAAAIPGDNAVPKKYLAAHYLGYQINPSLSVGLFEAVVFDRGDQLEWQYLNPIILYRTVEQMVGSPDNVLIGLDVKANLWKRFQLYGQLILDEFKFDELLLERRGWWANKFGVQAGVKYIDMFGIDQLDGQVEINTVRPYTYTHGDSTANYAHYNQPLAHPLGANFREWIVRLRYVPLQRLSFEGRFIQATVGEDEPMQNWGNNILLPSGTRVRDFDNALFQGNESTIRIVGLRASYQIFHNGFIELEAFYRKKETELPAENQEVFYLGGGFRMNIADRRYDF